MSPDPRINLIQLHAAPGYSPHQGFSPLSNRRDDA